MWRHRTRARRSSRCAGAIHDSGSRPINSNSRRCRASAQSVFGRLPRPFRPAVWTTSARCTSAPTRWSSSTRNRQPVVASNATSRPSPLKSGQELADPGAVRRRDPRAGDLAGDRVDPLRRDLRAMLIHPHHQRHATTTSSTAQTSSTRRSPARRAGHRIPSTTVGTSYSIGRPRGGQPRAPSTPFDAEGRPPSPPGVTPTGT